MPIHSRKQTIQQSKNQGMQIILRFVVQHLRLSNFLYLITKRSRLTEVENKLVDTSGERENGGQYRDRRLRVANY